MRESLPGSGAAAEARSREAGAGDVVAPVRESPLRPAGGSVRGRGGADLVCAMLVAVVVLLVLWQVHGEVVSRPNERLFSDQSEGMRNYYVLAWHSRWGRSWHEFEGMNYPFGEQLVYSEGQPLLSLPLQLWSRARGGEGVDRGDGWSAGALNVFLVSGIVLSGWLWFWVLRRLGVGAGLAVPAAVGIALLAPQSSRLPWMQPQAFSAGVPAAMLLLLWFARGGRARWLAAWSLLGLHLLLLSVNPYPGATTIGFSAVGLLAMMVLAEAPWRWRPATWLAHAGVLGVAVLVPLVLFVGYLEATDVHEARPDRPIGFFQFSASWCSLSSSFHSPLTPLLEPVTGCSADDAWAVYEGNGYLGALCAVALLLASGLAVRRLAARWWDRSSGRAMGKLGVGSRWSEMGQAQGLCLAAGALALFAFGWPFAWMEDGARFLWPLGPVGQFRAPGRFIWPLFGAANVLAMVFLWRVWAAPRQSLAARFGARGPVVLALGLLLWEGVGQHRWVAEFEPSKPNPLLRSVVDREPTLQHLEDVLEVVDPARYQAILTVPLFHVGSELLAPPSGAPRDLLRDAMALSVHTGLPLVSSQLGRVGREEVLETFRLYSPRVAARALCARLDERPFLVIANHQKPLHRDELAVVVATQSPPLLLRADTSFYELPVAKVCGPASGTLDAERGGVGNVDWQLVLQHGFEAQPTAAPARSGRGALTVPGGRATTLVSWSDLPPSARQRASIRVEFWLYNAGYRLQSQLFLEPEVRVVVGGEGGHEGSVARRWLPRVHGFDHVGEWSRFEFEFERSEFERWGLGVLGRHSDEPLYIDDLQVSVR